MSHLTPDPTNPFADACRAVFDLMRQHRIDVLDVEYDGCGDSGQVHQVSGYILPEPFDPPEAIEADAYGRPEAWRKAERIDDALFNAADLALSAFDPIRGWENNEGAFGTLTFDRPHRRAVIDHDWRITETENAQFQQEVPE